jgi:hypothetical protein
MSIEETSQKIDDYRLLRASNIKISRINDGRYDACDHCIHLNEIIRITPESGNLWLPGEIAFPQDQSSPTIIIGANARCDLRLGYDLKPIDLIIDENTDFDSGLSLQSTYQAGLRELKSVAGYTHVIERNDNSLPNSAIQISLPRRGCAILAYGPQIDIVELSLEQNDLPRRVATPLQGVVEDYEGELDKYDKLSPVVMWRDETVGITFPIKLDWRVSGSESTILSHDETLIIFNSEKWRYAIKIIQRPRISKSPYYWDRTMVYKCYPIDTTNQEISDELLPGDMSVD